MTIDQRLQKTDTNAPPSSVQKCCKLTFTQITEKESDIQIGVNKKRLRWSSAIQTMNREMVSRDVLPWGAACGHARHKWQARRGTVGQGEARQGGPRRDCLFNKQCSEPRGRRFMSRVAMTWRILAPLTHGVRGCAEKPPLWNYLNPTSSRSSHCTYWSAHSEKHGNRIERTIILNENSHLIEAFISNKACLLHINISVVVLDLDNRIIHWQWEIPGRWERYLCLELRTRK